MRTVRIKVTRSVDKWWRFCCFGRLFEVIPSSGENSFQIHCRSSFENQLQMICKWSANHLSPQAMHFSGLLLSSKIFTVDGKQFSKRISLARVCRSSLPIGSAPNIHTLIENGVPQGASKKVREHPTFSPKPSERVHAEEDLSHQSLMIRRVWWPNFGNWTLVRTKFLRRNLNCLKRLNSALVKKYRSAKWWITL